MGDYISFSPDYIRQLRNDCVMNAIDHSRATVKAAEDSGFIVEFQPPRVDVSRFITDLPPGRIKVSTAAQAEGTMLKNLLAIQRAERQVIRAGRVGWSMEQVCRRALDESELTDYLERSAHAKKVAQLQEQLAEAIARRARAEQEDAAATELAERYGLAQASQAPTKPKRATRSASK